jgi:hypothetical protein
MTSAITRGPTAAGGEQRKSGASFKILHVCPLASEEAYQRDIKGRATFRSAGERYQRCH